MNMRIISLCFAAAALIAGGVYAVLQPKSTPLVAAEVAPKAAPAIKAATAPSGEIVLTIAGGPDAAGQPIAATYDFAALQALPVTSFQTTTMWTDGIQRFEGVELKALLAQLNVRSGTVIATAINDYRTEIPVAEITDGAPIIAYKMNDAPMPTRDKGPLWIVYPYDSNAKYQSEVVFSRSIWQLTRLDIAP